MLRASLLSFVLVTLLGCASFASAQVPDDGMRRLPPAVAKGPGMGGVPVTAGDEVQKEQAKAANLQRQAEIRRDTEKMAQLTAELNDYLQKTDQGVMSVDAIKKAEQIEKLAHSVKSKMKLSF